MDPAQMIEAYRRLGVSPGADPATIRRAWRALVRAHHPDHATGCKTAATQRLAEVNAAFDLISTWTAQELRGSGAGGARPSGAEARPGPAPESTARRTAAAGASASASAGASTRADADATAGEQARAMRRNAAAQARAHARAAEAQARARAAQLDRLDAANRAARRAAERAAQTAAQAAARTAARAAARPQTPQMRQATGARELFLRGLRALGPRPPTRTLGIM